MDISDNIDFTLHWKQGSVCKRCTIATKVVHSMQITVSDAILSGTMLGKIIIIDHALS